ncbi:MAG: TraR/DksA C4-type zinc finger protein [Myxococcota bacterium]
MAKTPRTEEQEPLTPKQLKELRELLLSRKRKILEAEEQLLEADRESAGLRHADEVDLASAEWDVTVEHRMRGRDVALLKKITKALTLVDEGGYGECENCGNYIGYKRLLARPEATLCIECKEEQERVEKNFMKEAPIENPFSFE